MKKITSKIIILFAIIMSSCTSLDETPMDFVSPESVYDDINGFESMIVGCYGKYKSSCSDNMWITAGNQAFADNVNYTRYNVLPGEGRVLSIWSIYYELINNTNTILDNIDKVSNATEEEKNQIMGQAHFLRGLSYFYLVRYFGDVPLSLKEIKTPDGIYDFVREPQVKVYETIISDLQKAESFLPASWSGAPGKASKYAAKAVLSKVYLTMAGAPLKQTDKYALAAEKAKEIIDDEVFSLGDNWEDMFIPAKQNTHPSIIFQVVCLAGHGSIYEAPFYTSVSLLEGQTNPGMRVYGKFLRDFPEGPRKEATFYRNDQEGILNYLDQKDDEGNYTNAGDRDFNQGKKYFAKAIEVYGFTNKFGHIGEGDGLLRDVESDQNVLIFRYAEILLIYAEAQARADGSPNAEAYDAINLVRKRAYGMDKPLTPGLSKDAFVAEVVQERFYELAFESKRWFDVIRLELPLRYELYDTPGSYEPTKIVDAQYPTRYLMPIPLTERELNPNLTQNEGY